MVGRGVRGPSGIGNTARKSGAGPDDRVQQAIISGQNVQRPSPAATKEHSLQEVEASRPTVELQGAALGAADGAWFACSVRRMMVDAARVRCFHHQAHQHGR